MTPLRPARHIFAFVLTLGCAQATGTGLTGGGGHGGSGGSTTIPTYVACSMGMPCSPGLTCINGVCEKGCNTDADCAADEYCALMNGQVCQPRVLAACPATPCAPTQDCIGGLCGTEPTGMPCGANPFGGDGCPDTSLCLGNIVVNGVLTSTSVCYTLPSCDATHPCTPGGAGAICSTGFITGKKDMCIPGGCATDQNCPANWKCVPPVAMMGYGSCTDGASGHPCGKTADCQAGLQCYTPIMNMLGTCK